MDRQQVAELWDNNAEAWTLLTRMGCDEYRDLVNTPAFLAMLPDVSGLCGIDVGCGEGHNTRLVTRRGARMAGIDVSPVFIRHAADSQRDEPLGIRYQVASGDALPFDAASFDFAMATMSLMDMPDHERVVSEVYRVLKPGGFFQFSISHPCFTTPRWEWVRNAEGERDGVICGDYFREMDGQVDEWTFSKAPDDLKATLPKFRVPRFNRTLSGWLNLLLDTGFALERFDEPLADEQVAREHPTVADTRVIAYFLIVRARKV